MKSLKNFLLRGTALLMVLGTTLPSKAQQYYVFVYNNNYYIKNNDGTLESSTGFTSGAVWIASNTLGNTGQTVKSYTEQSKYLYCASNTSGNLSLSTTNVNWFTRNNALCSNRNTRDNNAYYPKHNGTNATISQGNNGNRYSYYTVGITSQGPTDNTTTTISISSISNNTITFSHSDLSGTFIPQYTRFVINTNPTSTHNWYNSTDYGTNAPSLNANTLSPTYTWSLQANGGGMASINPSTGVVTLSGAPTGNITVRLTVGNISPMADKTVDFTLSPAAVAQSTSSMTELSAFTVSPATAVLNNNTNRTFAATAQATTTSTTVPAHISLSGGGKEFYYYNNTLYASTDDFDSDPVVTGPTSDGISYAWTLNDLPTGVTYSGHNSANLTIAAGTMPDPTIATATVTVTASKGGASSTKSFTVDFYNGVTVVDEMSNLGASGYYVLAADIDASSFTGDITFTGTLDGRYHTISGLTRPLFTTVNGGTVKNVIIDKVTISGIANAGAICGTAQGNAKIYNCGVLSSDGTSSVSGTTNAGGLVGTIASGNVRVVNCYNYATVGGGTYAAGIVGRNQGTVSGTTTVNTTGVRITNCMMYGDMTAGTNRSPVYGGNHTNNVQQLHEYNYYRSRANLTYTAYNDQLAIDKDEYLTRFPFYRHIQNTHRELAAYFLFGAQPSAAQVDEIGHWVLKPEVAPYPIIEPWIEDTRRTTVDIAAHLPATTEKYAGKLLNNIGDDGYYTGAGDKVTAMGDGGYLHVTVVIGNTSRSVDLPITDMDTLAFDFTWGKVVLPFANEFDGWTRDYSKAITGWRITSITGGTAGTLSNYNFADRDCTAKDLYSNSNYIFAQGGNYIVPYGVTAITIEANMANAFYLSDARADFGYSNTYDGQTNLAWTMPTTYHGQTIYTSLATLMGALATTTNPHTQAIVLVGNYHYNQKVTNSANTAFENNTGKAFTIMSCDEDNNQEPDYGWYSYHTDDRVEAPPMRFDFVPNIGMGMAQRVNGSDPYPTIGIWHNRGWFELTETCVSFMSECEINDNNFSATDDGHGNNRWIANSGYFIQIVRARDGACNRLSYLQIGGNAYIKELYPGSHTDNSYATTLRPIVVTGGEVAECYMTGYKAGATAPGADIHFWCAGGRIHKYLSAYMENPSTNGVNVTAKVDHAVIRRFFGGGTSAAARITGNINITMNNSLVDFYCGGPEFGDMAAGRTVTTHATGSTFGEYYGAGFGGTSITYNREAQNSPAFGASTTYPLAFGTNYKRLTNNATYGIGSCYKFEYILYAGGSGSGVARFYTGYAQFSLATTGNVTNVLLGCTILRNYYGAGCQGKVDGTVTSTLTDCSILGSAFGGGYKAAANTVDVYPATQPTYSVYTRETGLFSDFGTVAPETFTWQYGATVGSNDANKILYTTTDMTTLGNVTGAISLTIDGGSVAGSVFGGGNESISRNNTNVILQGPAVIGGDVFGGGNRAPVEGDASVIIRD